MGHFSIVSRNHVNNCLIFLLNTLLFSGEYLALGKYGIVFLIIQLVHQSHDFRQICLYLMIHEYGMLIHDELELKLLLCLLVSSSCAALITK